MSLTLSGALKSSLLGNELWPELWAQAIVVTL